jgi:hypothetical protein
MPSRCGDRPRRGSGGAHRFGGDRARSDLRVRSPCTRPPTPYESHQSPCPCVQRPRPVKPTAADRELAAQGAGWVECLCDTSPARAATSDSRESDGPVLRARRRDTRTCCSESLTDGLAHGVIGGEVFLPARSIDRSAIGAGDLLGVAISSAIARWIRLDAFLRAHHVGRRVRVGGRPMGSCTPR